MLGLIARNRRDCAPHEKKPATRAGFSDERPYRAQRTDCMKRSKPASATLNQAFCDLRYFSNSV
jgi:hypothetical protein